MLAFFKQLKNRIIARHRGQLAEHSWVDWEEFFFKLRHSRVPTVLIITLVWVIAAVMLTLSQQKQHTVSDWIIGQKVPYTVTAAADFWYQDQAATNIARELARKGAPEFFAVSPQRTETIRKNFQQFWQGCLKRHSALRENGKVSLPESDPGSKTALELSPQLLEALVKEYLTGQNFLGFKERFDRMLSRGIIRKSDLFSRTAGVRVKTIDASGRSSLDERTLSEMPDSAAAATLLADKLFPNSSGSLYQEFRQVCEKLIGDDGNLDFDIQRTTQSQEEQASQVKPINVFVEKGALLVRKGETFTENMQLQAAAAQQAAQEQWKQNRMVWDYLAANIIWSAVLVAVVVFFLFRQFPVLADDSRTVTITGLVMIISLLVNAAALSVFDYLVREGLIPSTEFVISAVPIALGAVVLSVLVGYRISLWATFMISAVAAMMIMPDRSFELAIRWLATGAVAALTVRKVNNYRAFFVRSFIFTFVLVLSLAIVFATLHRELAPDREHFALLLEIALGNAFVVSVLALVIVFAFELIFNIDTNMALMVLSDYNHPLLERLKREAPGTMFHSMSVATLAEDAAREIGANVLRAKVGALFHDIGKLSKPHYFVENNRDSSNEHFKLNPQLSSSIIREHVKEGLALARQYRLFRWVHRAIISHHGDDLVYFFYQMAKKQQELSSDAPPVLESQFRYTGTPPREKELVIISLADACEAACRSLERPSPAKIEQLVDDIFLKRYQGGQLRNGELTLAELDRVKKSFVKSLLSIYHGRIAYSPENINEQTVLQVEKSGTSQTGKK